jgi:hypothetical protein
MLCMLRVVALQLLQRVECVSICTFVQVKQVNWVPGVAAVASRRSRSGLQLPAYIYIYIYIYILHIIYYTHIHILYIYIYITYYILYPCTYTILYIYIHYILYPCTYIYILPGGCICRGAQAGARNCGIVQSQRAWMRVLRGLSESVFVLLYY